MALITGSGWFSKEEAQAKGYSSWKRFWHNVWYVVVPSININWILFYRSLLLIIIVCTIGKYNLKK